MLVPQAVKLAVDLLAELRRIADALERISPPKNVTPIRRPQPPDELDGAA